MMKARDGIYYSDFYLSSGKRVRKSLDTRDKREAGRLEKDLQVRLEAELKGMVSAAPSAPAKAATGVVVPLRKPPCGFTLKEAFKRVKREREEWRTSKGIATLEANFGWVCKEFGEDADLTAIDRKAMRAYADKMSERGLSGSTINQRLSLVSVLLRYADEWTDGAVEPFKMPRRKPAKGRVRVLSRDEEFKVLHWCAESSRGRAADFHDLIIVLLDTGLRLSEALNIRSSEVDWDHGKVAAWVVKGNYAPRLVPMTQRVREILERRKSVEKPFSMFTRHAADFFWKVMRQDIGIDRTEDPEFVLHALRHTCASRLAASGMDSFRIQKWMGHKHIQTTMIYVTLFGSDLDALADALDAGNKKFHVSVPKSVPKTAPKIPVFGVPHGNKKHGSTPHKRLAPQGV